MKTKINITKTICPKCNKLIDISPQVNAMLEEERKDFIRELKESFKKTLFRQDFTGRLNLNQNIMYQVFELLEFELDKLQSPNKSEGTPIVEVSKPQQVQTGSDKIRIPKYYLTEKKTKEKLKEKIRNERNKY